MKVLVLGRGGREYAIAWKVSQSPLVKKVFVATGNAGTKAFAENIDIKSEDIDGLLKFALKEKIDLTLVGPEVAFTEGLVDVFMKNDLKIMGPTKKVSQLEGSKSFAKRLLDKYDIPTANYGSFCSEEEAFKYIEEVGAPLVIRADGLAAGKGVIIAKDEITAKLAVNVMMKDKIFGEAGRSVVIEEYMTGETVSLFAFVHKNKSLSTTTAQDYKRAYDSDRGPNTGGMGAFSPSKRVSAADKKNIDKIILTPVLEAMKKEGLEYSGIMFVSLIITEKGPKVIEFNLRFNDPLTQVILPRLDGDLTEIILKILNDDVKDLKIKWKKDCCIGIVGVSGGYPLKYQKGYLISGFEELEKDKDVILFHARTKYKNGQLVTSGGRIFDIVVLDKNMKNARKVVYEKIKKVYFSGIHFRKDIGLEEGVRS